MQISRTEIGERGGGGGDGRCDAGGDDLQPRLFRIDEGRRVGHVVVRLEQEDVTDIKLRDLVEDGQRQHHEHQPDQQVDCNEGNKVVKQCAGNSFDRWNCDLKARIYMKTNIEILAKKSSPSIEINVWM